MERATYQQVKDVFFAAAQLVESEVPNFLDSHCGNDSWLRLEVERLLLTTRGSSSCDWALPNAAVLEPAVPTKLGAYEIQGELGRGGMGVVYRAFDHVLQRPVAIKVLRGSRSEAEREPLRLEARSMAACAHPYIATVHAFESDGGLDFVVLELVAGESLAEVLRRGALGLDETLRLGHQLAEALESAHGQGIVHLDLKPSNLMVTPERRLKVLDFGLARSRERREGSRAGGTLGYMSAEQLNNVGVGEPSDIWAVGCILFECLTGKRAIPGEAAAMRVAETLHGETDLVSLPAETPPSFRQLIASCLERQPEARPASATELRRAIDACVLARQRPFAAEPGCIRARIPRVMSDILGRDALTTAVSEALKAAPLVTLVGFGGVGKTRLALEVVRRMTAGGGSPVVWLELGTLSDPAALWPTLASAIEVASSAEQGLQPTLSRLRELRPLVALDNCEHLIEQVSQMAARILKECPGVRLLATSREGLNLGGERLIEVPPLEPPAGDNTQELAASPALALLCERARSHGREFSPGDLPAAAELVRRLEGIPLAIELAAGRLKMLEPSEILERLDEGMLLLSSRDRDLPARHRTLRATLEWSYELLEPTERLLLQRISLFVGGWTLHSAEQTCSGDGIETWEVLDVLGALLSKSLVSVCPGTSTGAELLRYRLLESVRSFAREKLTAAGLVARWRQRFVETMTTLAESARAQMRGKDMERSLGRLDASHANLLAAVDAGLAEGGDAVRSLRIARALWNYWSTRGAYLQGTSLLRAALDKAGELAPLELRQGAILGLGVMLRIVGDYQQAGPLLEQAVSLAQEGGDARQLAKAMLARGMLAKSQGDHAQAYADYHSAVSTFRELGDNSNLASALGNLGTLRNQRGEGKAAEALFTEGLQAARAANEQGAEAANLAGLGTVLLEANQPEEACHYYERAAAIHRQVGQPRALASVLGNIALARRLQGAQEESIALFEESLAIRRELGDRRGETIVLLNMIGTGLVLKQVERARGWLRQALEWPIESRAPRLLAYALECASFVAQDCGFPEERGRLWGAASAIREQHALPPSGVENAERADWLAAMLADPALAAAVERGRTLPLEEAIAIAQRMAGK